MSAFHRCALAVALLSAACKITPETTPQNTAVKQGPMGGNEHDVDSNAKNLVDQGRKIFRDETFGSEEF